MTARSPTPGRSRAVRDGKKALEMAYGEVRYPARGDGKAGDPVERTSSRVQAVACFFPPTDFLNYGGEGQYAFARDGVLAPFRTAMDVREYDPRTKRLERVSEEKQRDLARRMSPI